MNNEGGGEEGGGRDWRERGREREGSEGGTREGDEGRRRRRRGVRVVSGLRPVDHRLEDKVRVKTSTSMTT